MKKINTVEIKPVTHTVVQMSMFPTTEYETVSGLRFKLKSEAVLHESKIVTNQDYYRKILNIFGIDYLKSIKAEWEEQKELWKRSAQYPNYVAGQYALDSIINEYEDKRSIESIFDNLRRGYYD